MYGGPDRRGMRKPLIVFTPKSLLRHPRAVSTLHDFAAGGFTEILGDTARTTGGVSRVVFCTGKLYYDLLAAREERKAEHVALVRVEQLYPFAADQARGYSGALSDASAEVVWAQEEPRNMGAWRFMREHLQPLLDATGREVRYVGRPESASPATGSGKRHQQEQAEIVNEALAPETVVAQGPKVRQMARRK